MKLTPQAITDFKQIYEETYGTSLSDREAEEMASRVLRLFKIIEERSPSTRQKSPANIHGDPLTKSNGTLA